MFAENFFIMREIKSIVIHCSATKEGVEVDEAQIEKWHKERFQKIGGKHIGYHILIYLDGTIIQTKGLRHIGQHVAGNNANTIGVCYIGGLNSKGKPKDTRTPAQKQSMKRVVKELKKLYPDAEVKGHRDFSPDLNGNGIIEPFEFLKDCPCFSVAYWLKSEKI